MFLTVMSCMYSREGNPKLWKGIVNCRESDSQSSCSCSFPATQSHMNTQTHVITKAAKLRTDTEKMYRNIPTNMQFGIGS